MNKEEKLKLAKKYFIQQKVKEIIMTLTIIFIIIFLPYFLGHNLGDNKYCKSVSGTNMEGNLFFQDTTEKECKGVTNTPLLSSIVEIGDHLEPFGPVSQWFEGFWILFQFGVIGLVLWGIYYLIKIWIVSNWNKAKERAGLR